MTVYQSGKTRSKSHDIVREDISTILQANLPWERFSGKAVLITGAAGLLASYLVKTFLALNKTSRLAKPVQVIGLVRNLMRAQDHYSEEIQNPHLRLIEADVSEPFTWLDTTDTPKVDFIVHAASPASPIWYTQDPLGTIRVNTEGTQHVLSLAKHHAAESVLYVSTSEVYGNTEQFKSALKETDMGPLDPLQLRSCYAESKRLGEALCLAWHVQHAVPTTIARPFHTFGPGLRLDDGRVFADFVGNVLRGEPIVLKSSGAAQRAFCYLSDATVGFLTVLLQGEAGQAYNVGNPDNLISMIDLANRLAALYPEKNIAVLRETDSIPNEVASTVALACPDIEKIKALGWLPQVGLDDCFRRTIASFAEFETSSMQEIVSEQVDGSSL